MTWLAAMLIATLQSGFTWTLYEGDGPLVLANEVPDTPRLRATMECEPGSGVARLDLYGASGQSGIATLTAGSAVATGDSDMTGNRRSVALRSDHPVFSHFVVDGRLVVAVGAGRQTVVVEAEHLPKLRRFAELCGG